MISRTSYTRLLPVPSASQISANTPSFSSYPKYGATENDASIPRRKEINVHTVTVYFPENFLNAGFKQFTTDVITVEHTSKIRIVLVIGIILKYKFYFLITTKKIKNSYIFLKVFASYKAEYQKE